MYCINFFHAELYGILKSDKMKTHNPTHHFKILISRSCELVKIPPVWVKLRVTSSKEAVKMKTNTDLEMIKTVH